MLSDLRPLAATVLACLIIYPAVSAKEYDAQSTVRMDAATAVGMALEKNFQIQVEQFSPLQADAALFTERGTFDPTLDFSYRRAEDSRAQQLDPRIPTSSSSELFITDTYEASVNALTPWGMTASVGLDTQNRRGTFNQFTPQYNTLARLQLTQPLLRGFGTDATMSQIRIARVGREIADEELRERIIDIVTRTLLVYNDLYFSYQNLAVAEQARNLAGQLVSDNTKRAEIGVMSPLDVTTARAQAAAREEDVITARRAVQDNENFLKQLVTDDIENFVDRRIVATEFPGLTPRRITSREAAAEALARRPDYQRALLTLKQQRIRVRFTRNQGLPRVDLVGSYGLNGLDSGFTDSLNRTFQDQNTDWNAGVVVSIPFPNRAGRGRVESARLEVARSLTDLRRLEQDIIVEVDNALGQIETTAQRIEATRISRVLAQEQLDAEEERLRAGSTTTFTLLEAQSDFAAARAAELRALTDHNNAILEFDRLTAATLQRQNVVFE